MKTTLFEITGKAIIVLAVLSFVSGCATLLPPNPVIIPVEKFPVFIATDGPDIDPASDEHAVPDVDVLALSEDMKRLLDESVADIKNPRKRLDALADVIDKNIRFETSEDKYGTKTAIETFEAGSGNCLSFSNLFVSMARYVGLKSGFEEIPTPPNWIKDGEVLLFTRHIGVMVDVYQPAQYVIDIISDYGSEKLVLEITDTRQYLVAPLLPLSLQFTLDSISTSSISDNRAFAQYYNNIGSRYLSEGNSRDAFRYFVKAIKVDPELSFVWSNLGVIYIRNNQLEAAERALLQALSINRDRDKLTTMTIMSNLVRLYYRQGRVEEAALYEDRVRSYRNMNPYYHYSMGEIAFYEGKYRESIEDFNEAIKRKSDDHQFYFALAIAYFKLGEIEEAEKNIDKAISYSRDKRIEEYYRQIWEEFTQI